MNLIAPILRIVIGLALIIVSVSRYLSIRAQMAEAEGGELEIFGRITTAEPWQLMLVFGVAGLVGIALLGLGGVSLMKKMEGD